MPVAGNWLSKVVAAFDHVAGLPGRSHFSLVFVDKNTIKKLNRSYRGKNSPTDVLSFTDNDESFIQPVEKNKSLGEVVICSEITKEQAKRFRQPLKWEVARLIIHGLAHLVGFDHEHCSNKQVKEMFDLERRALELLK